MSKWKQHATGGHFDIRCSTFDIRYLLLLIGGSESLNLYLAPAGLDVGPQMPDQAIANTAATSPSGRQTATAKATAIRRRNCLGS